MSERVASQPADVARAGEAMVERSWRPCAMAAMGAMRRSAGGTRRVLVRAEADHARRPLLSRQLAERIVTLLAPLLLLLLWEVLVQARLLDRRFFPAPSSIVGTFVQPGPDVAAGATSGSASRGRRSGS